MCTILLVLFLWFINNNFLLKFIVDVTHWLFILNYQQETTNLALLNVYYRSRWYVGFYFHFKIDTLSIKYYRTDIIILYNTNQVPFMILINYEWQLNKSRIQFCLENQTKNNFAKKNQLRYNASIPPSINIKPHRSVDSVLPVLWNHMKSC